MEPRLKVCLRDQSCSARRGFTLTELVVVLLILAALAGILVPTLGGLGERSKQESTEASLVRIRAAIVGDESGPGYVGDLDFVRPGVPAARDLLLRDLFAQPSWAPAHDPATRRGWNGPYLRHIAGRYAIDVARGFAATYGADQNPCVLDGWGNPIVVQRPTVGAGSPPATEGDCDSNLRLVSAGPNGQIDCDPDDLTPTDLAGSQGDDVVLFVFVAGV